MCRNSDSAAKAATWHRSGESMKSTVMVGERRHAPFLLSLVAVSLLLPVLVPFGAAWANDGRDATVEPLPVSSPAAPAPSAANLSSVFMEAGSFWLTVMPRSTVPQDDNAQIAATAAPSGVEATVVSQADASNALSAVVSEWQAAGYDVPDLSAVVTDLPDLTLGHSWGSTVQVDADAAGHGWGAGGMDLKSVLRHEVGHALGLDHGSGVMSATLSAGTAVTSLPVAPVVVEEPVVEIAPAGADASGALSVAPTLDFGRIAPGQSVSRDLVVTNSGNGDLDLADLVLDDSSGTFTVGGGPTVLAPGGQVAISVTMTAGALGTTMATLTFVSDDPMGSRAVTLTGVSSRWVDDGATATLTSASGSTLDHVLVIEGADVALVGLDGRDIAPVDRNLLIAGGNGDDRVAVSGGRASVAITIDGGSGTDTLVGPATDLTWIVSGAGSGSVAGIHLTSFEHLVGAADTDDTFVIADGGSLTGSVDGGDRGFDTLDIQRSVGAASSVATGPQSGVVTLDGASFTYAGLEPVTVSGSDTLTLTLDVSNDVAVLEVDPIDSEKLRLNVTSGTAESHSFAKPTTKLIIDLGAGSDVLSIGAGVMLKLAGIQISILGGAGSDTLTILDDLAGRWDITGIDAGTWTPNGGATVTFADIQHLGGVPTAAETYGFAEGGGITGSITDGSGLLTVAIAGFAKVTGAYSFTSAAFTGQDTAAGPVTGTAVSVSSTGGTVFVGLDPLDHPIGIEGTVTSFGMVVITDGTHAWQAMSGSVILPTLVGAGELLLDDSSTFTIAINTVGKADGAADRPALDFSGTHSFAFGPGVTPLSFAGSTIGAGATDVTISIGQFLHISGDVSFEKSSGRRVVVETSGVDGTAATDLAAAVVAAAARETDAGVLVPVSISGGTISNLAVETMTFGIAGATVFAGYNPAGFSLFDVGVAPGDLEALGAVGLLALGIDLALVFATATDDELAKLLPGFTALKAEVATLQLVGLPADFGLQFRGIEVATNIGGQVKDGTGTPDADSEAAIDWAASFPGTEGLVVTVLGTTTSVTIDAEQTTTSVTANGVLLSLGGFVTVAGSFSFTQGGTEDVSVVRSDAVDPIVVEVATTVIGIGGASVFVGDPGSFDAIADFNARFDADGEFVLGVTQAGFECDVVEDESGVGVCIEGIDVGVLLAKATANPELPRFMAIAGGVALASLIGLPEGFIFVVRGLSFDINRGGAVTGTPVPENAFIDWAASFPGSGTPESPGEDAGYEVDLGGGRSVTITSDEATIGVAAEQALLRIGDFVRIAGSFSFKQGVTKLVQIAVEGLDTTQTTNLTDAATTAGIGFDGSVLTAVKVTTTLIGIGEASLFAGYAPNGFEEPAAGDPFDCDLVSDAFGLCVDGVTIGIGLASLTDPTLLAGFTLPSFMAVKIDIADVELLGIPTDLFTLEFDGLYFALNRGGEISTGQGTGATPIVNSLAYVQWGESGDLTVPTGTGDQVIDLDDPVIVLGADIVLLAISDFVAIRGAFRFEQGARQTVTVRTAELGANLTNFNNAVDANPDLTRVGTAVSGLQVVTTLISVDNAAMFAGYNPDGFDVVAPIVCADLKAADEAIGVCADGINVAIVLASLLDPEAISGFKLPGFMAAKVTIDDLALLGIPEDIFDLGFEGIALTINRGGTIGTGTAGTAIVGSLAWIDWAASFPDSGDGAGLEVGALRIDMVDPVLAISADVVYLTISDFISIRGSFAFQQGGLVNLAIESPTLTDAQLGTLADTVIKNGGSRVGDTVIVEDVQTTTIGIGGANVYIGYADGGFGDDGMPVDPDSFYGLFATDIDLGLILAKIAASRIAPGYTLPNFFGLSAEIASLGFSGIPTDVFDLSLTGITVSFNGAGVLGGFTSGASPPTAHVNWKASKDSASTIDGVAVPTDSSGGTIIIDHEDAIIGVAAVQVVLGIGDFIRVSGSFSFEKGAQKEVDLGVAGLTLAEYNSLRTATASSDVTVTGTTTPTTVSNVTIEDLVVNTTLIGIGHAGIFVGYNPDGFTAGAPVNCTDLDTADNAFGFCLDGIELGLVLADALPGQLGALIAPRFMALKASLPLFNINTNFLGLPDTSDVFDLYFKGLQLTVNNGGVLGMAGTAWIDWEASFPDEGDGAGLVVPTGSSDPLDDVLIDFDSPVVGVSADLVVMSISEFVHVSGSFAFETGGRESLDIDVLTPTGLQRYLDVQVKTTTFGIGDASIYVGYAPGGFDITASGDPDILERSDLDGDATGLLLSDIDLGMVFATADATQAGIAAGARFPTFWALKANVGDFELVNLLPSSINIQLEDIGVMVNGGGQATGTFAGKATADWSGSFPGTGFEIPTSTTNEDPIIIDFRGPVIGVSAGLVVISISEFVHISGGFSFVKGETLVVDIQTGLTLLTGLPLSGISPIEIIPGGMYRETDNSVIHNVAVDTIQLGINDASVFIGYNPNNRVNPDDPQTFDLGIDDPATADIREDRILSRDELSDDAIGLFASDADFGMVLSSIIPSAQFTPLGVLPRFTTLKGSIAEFSVLGLEDFFTFYLRHGRVEVNMGGKWSFLPSAPVGPAIDWTTQTYDDDDNPGTAEVPGGYGIATGGDNPDIVVDMENFLIGGGVDLMVLGIGDFVHLRGAAYFEMGATDTVPLVGIIDTSILDSLFGALPQEVQDAIGLDSKELRFLNFGAQDVYAFLGVGGPHWLTEDPDDLTSDLVFECDPTQASSGCVPPQCEADSDTTDGIAEADDDPECRAVRRESAIGIAVSDLDFAFAMGTPTLQADPTRYYTLRASIDEAALIGLEDEGLTARLLGVSFEVNISTPTVSAFPLLPVIDWEAYALDSLKGNCSADDLTALAVGDPIAPDCEPFGVRTGRVVAGEDVREYFVYDGLYIRAAVRLAQIDVFGVLVARGSLALVLGPTVDVTLVDGTEVTGVTTMTIGGANLFAFLGVNGPHWTEDPITNEIIYTDTGLAGGTRCDPEVDDPDTDPPCLLVENPDAIGLALTDLDFGLFIGAKLDPLAPAAFVAANITIDNFELVGIPGLTANAMLAIAINLGFMLSGAGVSASGINFKESFSFDEDYDENDNGNNGDLGVPGFLLDTGDPANPMVIDFDSTFIEVQLAGSLEIRAGPDPADDPIVRIDGIFYLGVDLDAGAQEFRLLALGEMTIGPDIGSVDPLLSIGAIGVLILNSDGIAGDFTVNLEMGGPIEEILDVSVYARVIFNTAAKDMTIELPDELYEYLDNLTGDVIEGVANPGPMAQDLLDRLEDCDPGDGVVQLRCYTISGRAPNLVSGTGPDVATVDWLLGDGLKPDLSSEPLEAYLVAVIDGEITILGFASAEVFGAIRISGSEFELIAHFKFQLGSNPAVSILVEADAISEISALGFYLSASVSIEANLLSVFDLDVSGSLLIDTRGATTEFRLVLNGSVSILQVITLDGSLTILVGGPIGEDAWYIGASLSADFGPLALSASGFISSWGSFSLTLTGSVDISFAGTGIDGSVTAHVSYCARPGSDIWSRTCLDDVQKEIAATSTVSAATTALIQSFQTDSGPLVEGDRSFLAALGGRVRVKILGITLAGVGIDVEIAGYLGDLVKVRATFTVETIFGDISKTVTIATFQLPNALINGDAPPPNLATNESGTLRLNVGSRAGLRAVGLLEIDEEYTITQVGSTVTVSAFGWTETHTGVTHIEGLFGDGNDELLVYSGVTATVYADGGIGNDVLSHSGTAGATLLGGIGDDVLVGGPGVDILNGGLGDDYLDGGGSSDTMIGGPVSGSPNEDDDTFFGYGSEFAGETLDTGYGHDRIEVIGLDGPETITLSVVSNRLELDYDGAGSAAPLNLTGIDEMFLRLSGGDTLTVDGSVATQLEVLTITSESFRQQVFATAADVAAGLKNVSGVTAAVGDVLVNSLASSDTVILNLDASAGDVVDISSSNQAAPRTYRRYDGVFELVGGLDIHGQPIPGALATSPSVPTTVVDWGGRIFTIANTGLATNDHDLLTLNTLGGDDRVSIRSLLTDLTVDLGGGSDIAAVGSNASCEETSCSGGSGQLSTIDAPLMITGGAATDAVIVDDRGDISGDIDVVLTMNRLTGADLYGGAVGELGIRYGGLETLVIELGSGADVVHVRSTSATTTVRSNGDGDDFYVSSDSTPGDTTPTGDINGVGGALTIDGGAGSDDLVIVDLADTTGDTGQLDNTTLTGFSPATITYLSFATLDLTLGSGNDTLEILSLLSEVLTADIEGSGGNDWFDVDGFDGGLVTIRGGDGDDTFDIGSDASTGSRTVSIGGTLDDIDGALVIHGDAPGVSDWLYVDDTGNATGRTGILTSSTITGFGLLSTITYLTVEHLQIALGSAADVANVTSTNGPGDAPSGTTETTLLLGGGADVVNISSNAPTNTGNLNAILGHVIIDGQGGIDTVNASDSGETVDDSGELTATDLTGLGTAGINYAGLEYLNIDLGTGGDTFTVHSTHVGESTLDTRGGNDAVDVGGPAQDLYRIDGFLDIDMGTGTDDVLTVNGHSATGEQVGTVTATTVEGLGTTIDPLNEASDAVWAVTIDGAGSGDVTLTIGSVTTAAFAFNSTTDVVRNAIVTALAASSADVLVSRTGLLRGDGVVFRITFTGALGGQAGHDLGAVTVTTTSLTALPTQTVTSSVVAATTGRIEYTNVETFELNLGDGADHVALASTGALTTINGGDGADVLDVETIDHATTVNGQGGDDTLQVNLFPQTPETNDIDALLTLDGAADSDTFFIQMSSTGDSFFDVVDTGASGIDNLYVQGSVNNDQFLLRAELVALLNNMDGVGRYQNAEYVSYGSGIENLVVNTLAGNDRVTLDDTTVATTVNLGAGADQVQIGQLFGEECIDDFLGFSAGLAEFNCFDERFIPPALIDTTQGMISNGISASTTVNGGGGNDLMIVFHNLAVLALNGEAGDDTFVIRTFLEEDSVTQLDAGQGADVISYVMNSPVNVNGGDGYDRLYIVGTEADDTFVITEDGVYGGGRFVSFVAVELLGIDTVEGNDLIYVQSTDPNVVVEVYGGLGSDTIEIGSNLVPTGANGVYAPIYAAADDLIGHSGLIVHNVESTSGTWNDLVVDGIAAEVVDNDEAAVLIVETGGTTIVREGSTTDTYQIVLTQAPAADVRIDVLAAILTPEQELDLAYNVQLSLNGSDWSERGISLVFTAANWSIAQTVYVRAYDDLAREGLSVTAIRHAVTGSGAYDGVVLNDLNVLMVDNDVVEVVILQSGVDTTVGEAGLTDTYTVELSAPSAGPVTVTVASPTGVCVSTLANTNSGCGPLTITFAAGAIAPVTVTVRARLDTIVEGFQYGTIVHTATGAGIAQPSRTLLVGVIDNDTRGPGVVVTESNGSTVVAEGGATDSYTIELTADPGLETVTLTLESISTKTQYDPDIYLGGDRITRDAIQVELRWRRELPGGAWSAWSTWSVTHAVQITSAQWQLAIEVEVRALDDVVIDGRILQAFPQAPARVNRIQGALYVDGGVSAFGYPLANFVPVLLPGESSTDNFITPNPAFDAIEEYEVDTLIVHNEGDVADSTLVATTTTATPTQLSDELLDYLGQEPNPPGAPADVHRYALLGLGMGAGGIEYDGLEVLDVLLGSGADRVTVVTTHEGTTTIRGNGGNDTFDVLAIEGHTRILGGDGNDTITVTDDGLLDAINAQLLVSGDAGNDTTIVDDTADGADDLGTLTQTSLVGLDMVADEKKDMFSLELSDDVTAITITVTASRNPDLLEDDPGLSISRTFTIDAAAIRALAAIAALPYGDYAGKTVADLDAFLLAGLIQQALFPWVANFGVTGCGSLGTTGARDSRCPMSVYAWDSGGRVYLVGFHGLFVGLDVGFSVAPIAGAGAGTATDLLRTDGITYDTLETLDIRLGSGNDRFNVRGTLPHTLLNTGAGDDVVFVSDAADLAGLPEAITASNGSLTAVHDAVLHGTVTYDDLTFDGSLDEIDGRIDIDTAGGSNTLAVSDRADADADLGAVLSDNSITGFSTGAIGYVSTGGDLAGQGKWTRFPGSGLLGSGLFGRGITIHAGTGNDGITIQSVRGGAITGAIAGAIAASPLQMTITTLYANDGNDQVTITAPDVDKARLVVYGENGNDTIDAQAGAVVAALELIVFGNDGNDTIKGGSNADILIGDDGRVVMFAAGGGFDVILGGNPVAIPNSVTPGGSSLGQNFTDDRVFETVDVVFSLYEGGTPNDDSDNDDEVRGGAGNDLVIGGIGNDGLDGGADDDIVVGDQAIFARHVLSTSPTVRGLAGTTLYGGVLTTLYVDPRMGRLDWTITLLDASFDTPGHLWGNDFAAGGSESDFVFGQLGDDTLHGDGALVTGASRTWLIVTNANTALDADDHVEGNDGNDNIRGGLGQDSIIGGSSNLFGLITPDMRHDGTDDIWGGNGEQVVRNGAGVTDRGRDADVILGDNGNIYRIVGAAIPTALLAFNYDNLYGGEQLVPRAVQLLDYSPTGEAASSKYWNATAPINPSAPVLTASTGANVNFGGGDLIHGEDGNDTIHGQTGNDVIFGDAHDDDIYGEAGTDWISGGTGDDGILGDDGTIHTSRNGLTEPLYGITVIVTTTRIDTPGDLQVADVNITNELNKRVDLEPFYTGYNDIVFGGWGNDFIHGGEGSDALSGAEALDLYYDDDAFAVLADIYRDVTDVLNHGFRLGEFEFYDEFDPRSKIMVKPVANGSSVPFLLTNLAVEGGASGDGKDVIFGDGGSDWIVGGTNHDRLFGGWGDDLLNADDDPNTNGGANNAPDVQAGPPTYADIAYGGAGRDILIANTGADRLIDWVGEFNSYIVPFSPYGAFTISRSNAPHLRQYVLDLAKASGADFTRGATFNPDRNGEPYGELGMVTQQDPDWSDQTGAPGDPQAGNLKGPRDVLRVEAFTVTSTALAAFAPDSGTWSVVNGRYESTAVRDQDAVSLFYVDAQLPSYYEVTATVSADQAKAGFRSNAFLIIDYRSAIDYKFAGIEIGTSKVQIGRRTQAGLVVLAQANMTLVDNRNYNLVAAVNGQTVTLYVDGVQVLAYTFASPLVNPNDPSLGVIDPLTDGLIGVGSNGAKMRLTRMAVQTLAPEITFSHNDEFDVAPLHQFVQGVWNAAGGVFSTSAAGVPSLSLTSLTVVPAAILEAMTTITTNGVAGFAFDVYGVNRFKLVVLDAANGRLIIGHYVNGVFTVDTSSSVVVKAAMRLGIRLDGNTVSVSLEGAVVLSHAFFSVLNDGLVGLVTLQGNASFDHLLLRTDDPDLVPALPLASVNDVTVAEGNASGQVTVTIALSRPADNTITIRWSTVDGSAIAGQDYVAATGSVTIAAGQQSATIVIGLIGDVVEEADEYFVVAITDTAGAFIGDGSGRVTIGNDDKTVTVSVGVTDASASEIGANPATFTVTRDGVTVLPLQVRITWSGQAVRGVDYTVAVTGGSLSADGRTLTIAAGSAIATLTVTPLVDSSAEGAENVVVSIDAQAHYAVLSGSASAVIQDNTSLPALSVLDNSVAEGDRRGWVTVTIRLSAPSTSTVTVTVRTYDGTASAGSDYDGYVGSVSFGPGQTAATVQIRLLGDRNREGDETFTLELSGPVGAVIADGVGIVTIMDDDGARLVANTMGSGDSRTTLTSEELAKTLDAAIAVWLAAGVDPELLSGLRVELAELDGVILAEEYDGLILVDIDAAGWGWHLDAGSAVAAGRIDLLSVLLHEIGHVLGFDHTMTGVMSGSIDAGTRSTVDNGLAGPVAGVQRGLIESERVNPLTPTDSLSKPAATAIAHSTMVAAIVARSVVAPVIDENRPAAVGAAVSPAGLAELPAAFGVIGSPLYTAEWLSVLALVVAALALAMQILATTNRRRGSLRIRC